MVKQKKVQTLKKTLVKHKAIQSYLYKKPQTPPTKTMKATQENQEDEKLQNKPIKAPKIKQKKPSQAKIFKEKELKQKKTPSTELSSKINKSEYSTHKNTQNNTKTTSSTSALAQLENLRSSINKKIIAKEFARATRPRGFSAMTDLPDEVPHSKKQLTAEDEKEKEDRMNTNYAGGITITNDGNGKCTLKQDLSYLGMDGLTALSDLKCGQTKMEKWYDAHMTKVLKKLGKQ
jgi:hypothetical protein